MIIMDKSTVLYLTNNSTDIDNVRARFEREVTIDIRSLFLSNTLNLDILEEHRFGTIVADLEFYFYNLKGLDFLRHLIFNLHVDVYVFDGKFNKLKTDMITRQIPITDNGLGDDIINHLPDSNYKQLLNLGPVIISNDEGLDDYLKAENEVKNNVLRKLSDRGIMISFSENIEIINKFDIILINESYVKYIIDTFQYPNLTQNIGNESVIIIVSKEKLIIKRYKLIDEFENIEFPKVKYISNYYQKYKEA